MLHLTLPGGLQCKNPLFRSGHRAALIMANGLRVGQRLRGELSIYTILEQIHSSMYIATYSAWYSRFSPYIGNARTMQKVTIKQAPDHRLDNEIRVLRALKGNQCIRPLVDTVKDPPSLSQGIYTTICSMRRTQSGSRDQTSDLLLVMCLQR